MRETLALMRIAYLASIWTVASILLKYPRHGLDCNSRSICPKIKMVALFAPHIWEDNIPFGLNNGQKYDSIRPLLLPLLPFLSVLCCYQYQFYDLIFVIEIISKLPYLLSISFLYFHIVIELMPIVHTSTFVIKLISIFPYL